ncbi:MAG: energy-coupling factor transport system ATP-binding protein, partial [Thermoleophilaceae bacterium]|nr:energy-coupling factor transport system ATP-binding protein [Thermoleophilaceae bacterium]
MPPEPILSARGFTYAYPEGHGPALRDLTIDLAPGSFTVLAGESGSGKSTLVRAACGLVPHFHGGEASGELHVGGLSVRDHGPSDLAPIVGTVFQDPETQVVMGGVRAELSLPLEHRGVAPAAIARAVEETALALGIAGLLDRRTDTLSGGELQRVALGAALVHRPALLVLDEPTSQLDPVAGDELVWLLRRLNEEWGTAVLIAEHRLERCLGAADRVIALRDGAVACDGDPGAFLAWAAREACALATPGATLFSLAGLTPLPASVKDARAALRGAGLLPNAEAPALRARPPRRGLLRRREERAGAALDLRGVWYELPDGPALLRGIDLRLAPGESVALMGRNGAGKSTLLRHVKGLLEPTRGNVTAAGDVALLLQNPGDYLIHEHAEDEAGPGAVAAAGLAGRERANPRDLSGGERQRLALEIVMATDAPPAVACLDEPTRGMDRARKDALAQRLR